MAIAAYTRVCAKNVTGNLRLYLSEVTNITSIVVTANEIATFTAGATSFKKTEGTLDTLTRTEKAEGGKAGYKFTHEIKMGFAKPSTALKTQIESLEAASPCGIAAVILDGNGQAWLVGYNQTDLKDRGLAVVDASLDTGMAPGEDGKQGFDVTLRCISSEHALPFNSVINATIVGASAAWLG
jgi:hypothetical protein